MDWLTLQRFDQIVVYLLIFQLFFATLLDVLLVFHSMFLEDALGSGCRLAFVGVANMGHVDVLVRIEIVTVLLDAHLLEFERVIYHGVTPSISLLHFDQFLYVCNCKRAGIEIDLHVISKLNTSNCV